MKMKLRMMWAILRGRTVVYRAHIDKEFISNRTQGAIFAENINNGVGTKVND